MPKTESTKSNSQKTTRRVRKPETIEAAPVTPVAAVEPAAKTAKIAKTSKPMRMTEARPTTETAARVASTNPGPDAIARRAYELWRARGCRMGGEEQQRNWLEAERQLADERTARTH